MSSRWLVLVVAALLAGFGGGYLAKADYKADGGLVIKDGPVIQIKNQSKKDTYLIITLPKPGASGPLVTTREGTVSIRKVDLRYLQVYRLEESNRFPIDRFVRPCQCSPPIPPPPPTGFQAQILPGG